MAVPESAPPPTLPRPAGKPPLGPSRRECWEVEWSIEPPEKTLVLGRFDQVSEAIADGKLRPVGALGAGHSLVSSIRLVGLVVTLPDE